MRKTRLPGTLPRDSPSPLGHPISPVWAEVEGRGEGSNAKESSHEGPQGQKEELGPTAGCRKVIDAQNAQKQVSRELAGCQAGGSPELRGGQYPDGAVMAVGRDPGASWRNACPR